MIKVIKSKFRVKDLFKRLNDKVDIFICCGSYESRCRTLADQLDPEDIQSAIIAENVNLENYVGENTSYLNSRFREKGFTAKLNSNQPLVTADALALSLKKVGGRTKKRYLIDITTFTHESLLILIKLLRLNLKRNDEVFFAYTSAAEYSIMNNDKDKWLSKGLLDIRSVLGYPGEISPSLPMHLIVLVGYEYERAARLIEVLEPRFISLGYGRAGTSTESKHQSANEHFHRLTKNVAGIYGNVMDFTFSCSDPIDSMKSLNKAARRVNKCNLYVAPMNTKISTLGTALAAMANNKMRLCYAQPMRYNYINYSIPGDYCYLFEVKSFKE